MLLYIGNMHYLLVLCLLAVWAVCSAGGLHASITSATPLLPRNGYMARLQAGKTLQHTVSHLAALYACKEQQKLSVLPLL
jgi:hypothetical protein